MARLVFQKSQKRKRLSMKEVCSRAVNNGMNPFEMLSDELHSHILSFLTCLRIGHAEPASNAEQLYVAENIQDFQEQFPSVQDAKVFLAREFMKLPWEERQYWYSCQERDRARFEHEDEMMYTRPHQLTKLCEALSVVSKKWQRAVDIVMNQQAPREIITPLQLASLKRRALSLSLSRVCKVFERHVQQSYGDVCFPSNHSLDNDYYTFNYSPLEVVTQYFQYRDEWGGLRSIITTDYARFLVVCCVEMLAALQEKETQWKQQCSPCELVEILWKSHMLFPKKYAHDCFKLLGPLLPNSTPMDTVIDTTRNKNTDGLFQDYQHKRAVLFTFEEQLDCDQDCFYAGRFGAYYMSSSVKCLLQESFDVIQAADACNKEEFEEDDFYG